MKRVAYLKNFFKAGDSLNVYGYIPLYLIFLASKIFFI